MKKEALLSWIDAMESGGFSSSKARLRTSEGFCPLGILCELSGVAEWEESETKDDITYYKYCDEDKYLPSEVADWVGLKDKEKRYMPHTVMAMHDQGVPMNEVVVYLRNSYGVKNG